MKRTTGVNIHQKVIIVHKHWVSEEIKGRFYKKYPHALVELVHVDAVSDEASNFKANVTAVICMPDVTCYAEIHALWPSAQVLVFEETKEKEIIF
jgi:hypothetical protein